MQLLSVERPSDAIEGEEGPAVSGNSDVAWLIDPIDGTTSFLYGRHDWAVSVAASDRRDGTVQAGAVCEAALGRMTVAGLGLGVRDNGQRCARLQPTPASVALVEVNLGSQPQRAVAGEMITALATRVRDVRRGGSAAAALAALATGRADAVWAPGLQPWDSSAGVLIAAEVGDLEADSRGRWPASGDILAAEPMLRSVLRTWLQPVYAVADALASTELSATGSALAADPLTQPRRT